MYEELRPCFCMHSLKYHSRVHADKSCHTGGRLHSNAWLHSTLAEIGAR